MKKLLLALSFCLALDAAVGTYRVCASGCDATTVQAAHAAAIADIAASGSTGITEAKIVITAGYTGAGDLRIRGNVHDITYKSSCIDTYPRGYRITRSHPCLALINTVDVGEDNLFWTWTAGSDTLTNYYATATPTAHNLVVGDKITMGGGLYSMFHCGVLDQAPFGTLCDASKVGFLNLRTAPNISDGTVVYIQARVDKALPYPLTINTPYYVRDFYPGVSTEVTNCSVSRTSSTVLTMQPCRIERPSTTNYNNASTQTFTNTGGSNGYVYFYENSSGQIAYKSAGPTLTCTGTCVNEGAWGGSYPAGAKHLYQWNGVSSAWHADQFADNRGDIVTENQRFKLATSLGGAAINICQVGDPAPCNGATAGFNPAGQDFNLEVPPYPARRGQTLYVVNVPTTVPAGISVKLSDTFNGGALTFTQAPPIMYNEGGASLTTGVKCAPFKKIRHLTFDGIEVLTSTETLTYFPFFIRGAYGPQNNNGETDGVRVLRSWIHGRDDQENFPLTTARIYASNLEIGYSIIEKSYSNGNDHQALGLQGRNMWIHDNLFSDGAQDVFVGGDFPPAAPDVVAEDIIFERNYFYNALKYWHGMQLAYVSASTFRIAPRGGITECDQTPSDAHEGAYCFWIEGSDEDPANNTIARYKWTSSLANSTFALSATPTSGKGYLYGQGGALKFDYSYNGGAVTVTTCPSGITCTNTGGTAPTIPVGATRTGAAVPQPPDASTGFTGAFTSDTFYQENRHNWQKPQLEFKGGSKALVQGNVFNGHAACDGGTTCQTADINLTVAPNGSGTGEPMNYNTRTDFITFRNNIARRSTSGFTVNGQTYEFQYPTGGFCKECAGFGSSAGTRVENNLFYDIGNRELTAPGLGSGYTNHSRKSANGLWAHNTAVDVRFSMMCESCTNQEWRNNIFTTYRALCSNGVNCNDSDATGDAAAKPPQNILIPAYQAQTTDATADPMDFDYASFFVATGRGTMRNNIMQNRMGYYYQMGVSVYYPNNTWLIDMDDYIAAERNPVNLFKTYVNRTDGTPPNGAHFRTADFRLAGVNATWASGPCVTLAPYEGSTGRCVGADIDEIEAITGSKGDDVVYGRPTFAVRSQRQVSTTTTTATIKYLATHSTCTTTVYPDKNYRGTPKYNSTDSAATWDNGRKSITVTGLDPATTYYAKRWCGSSPNLDVDVFSLRTL